MKKKGYYEYENGIYPLKLGTHRQRLERADRFLF